MTDILAKLMSFPMGSGTMDRYFNGLIQGGGVIFALFAAGLIAF